jgi:hypothetical protein
MIAWKPEIIVNDSNKQPNQGDFAEKEVASGFVICK